MANEANIIDDQKIDDLLERQLSFFGKDKALTILLNQEDNYRKAFLNQDIKLVLETICNEFNYTYAELIHSKEKTWQRGWALRFCCYYLHKKKQVKMRMIIYVLNRSRQLICRYSNQVLQTDDKLVMKFRNLFDKKLNITK